MIRNSFIFLLCILFLFGCATPEQQSADYKNYLSTMEKLYSDQKDKLVEVELHPDKTLKKLVVYREPKIPPVQYREDKVHPIWYIVASAIGVSVPSYFAYKTASAGYKSNENISEHMWGALSGGFDRNDPANTLNIDSYNTLTRSDDSTNVNQTYNDNDTDNSTSITDSFRNFGNDPDSSIHLNDSQNDNSQYTEQTPVINTPVITTPYVIQPVVTNPYVINTPVINSP